MKFDPDKHHRRSIRLHGFDYSSEGAYFVTVCTHGRVCMLSHVIDGQVKLSPFGEIVAATWDELPTIFSHVQTDAFVVMPNHLHFDLFIAVPSVGAGFPRPLDGDGEYSALGLDEERAGETRPYNGIVPKRTLCDVVRHLKYETSKRINELRETPGSSVWQRNYYEHIIRSDASLHAIRSYIELNPVNWSRDSENPEVITKKGVVRERQV